MRRKAALTAFGVLLATSPAFAIELPNGRLTPGAIANEGDPAPTIAAVCVRGYARSVPHRYDSEWRRYRVAMFREYGIPHELWSHYTVDHLVPIELGGRPFGIVGNAWDLRNVWPEPKAEAEQKDAVENALHEAVCLPRRIPRASPVASASRGRDLSRLDTDSGRLTVALEN